MKVLIDFSWALYRSFHSKISTSWLPDDSLVPFDTTTIFGMLQMNKYLHNAFPPNTKFYWCTEPRKNFRHKEGSYKQGRNSDVTVDVFSWKPEVLSMLNLFKRNELWTAENGEADDVIWTLGNNFAKEGEQVYIHSSDNDLLPLMDRGCMIFRKIDKGKPIFLTQQYLDEKYCEGLKPSMVPMFKVIAGDSGDTIPSIIPRFPRTAILEIVKNCRSVDEMMDFKPDSVVIAERLNLLKAKEEQLRANEHLVKLRMVEPFPVVLSEYKPPKYFIEKYGLNTLRRVDPNELVSPPECSTEGLPGRGGC